MDNARPGMRRREFITLLGGAATMPLAARAQQPALPVIGYIDGWSPEGFEPYLNALRQGLSETGYADGTRITLEHRWAHGDYSRLPALLADLIQRKAAVIVTGTTPVTRAAKAATTTVPIVFVIGADPVRVGIVGSLNRPGGNVTGVSFLANSLLPKQFEVLHETVPKDASIGFLVNPINPNAEADARDVQTAANALGRRLLVVQARTDSDFEPAFAMLAKNGVGALCVDIDPFFITRPRQLVALAARHALPAIYPLREFATAGGLMSYGSSFADAYRQAGVYAGRILNGASPAALPVQQAVKVELVINLKIARTLGLAVPLSLLGRADEVIE
jgi:putative ABC transport system substrate-binding protein